MVTAKDVIWTFIFGLILGVLYAIAWDVNEILHLMVEPETPVVTELSIL